MNENPTDLLNKKCIPCEGGMAPMTAKEVARYLPQLETAWALSPDNTSISHEFTFKNFAEAMRFVEKVADISEREGHHPDIHIRWNKVRIDLSTHAIKGLSENDFILARKIEEATI